MTYADALRKTRELKLYTAINGEKETKLPLSYLNFVEGMLISMIEGKSDIWDNDPENEVE